MRILLIGCGRMGAGLALTLSRRGNAVTVLDHDPMALERLGPDFHGRTVLGNGFDRNVLHQAGIERAEGLAALTGSDETNVVLGRLARDVFRVPRVVARLDDPRKAEIYERLGLQTIAPVVWGVHRVADLMSALRPDTIAVLDGGEVELIEIPAPAAYQEHTVSELLLPGERQVVAVRREGRTMLPAGDLLIRAGDRLYLAVASATRGAPIDVLAPARR